MAVRIAYGLNRREADFKGLACDRFYLDTNKTNRQERRDMLAAIREADVLVLLTAGDLGRGGELPNLRAEIEARGAAIETRDPEPGPPKRPGRKPHFAPTPEQDEKIKVLWHEIGYTGPYVLRRAREITGQYVQRYHLTHRYGPRRETGE